MVQFINIRIQNFYSIKDTEYSFTEGITKIVGVNLDNKTEAEVVQSNGAGKSTLFYAISQCLFNRNIKIKKGIETTYNRVTNKPYTLTLDLQVDDEVYKICNNRVSNNITIIKEGVDISPKGVKNQLLMIEGIIGVDFNTFTSLTYLNQSSLLNIINLTSDKNILYRFFNLHKLFLLDKDAKIKLREAKKSYATLVYQEKNINKSIKEFGRFKKEDVSDLHSERQRLEVLCDKLKVSTESDDIIQATVNINNIKDKINGLNADINILNNDKKHTNKHLVLLEQGECPTCGNTIDASSIEGVKNTLSTIVLNIKSAKDKLKQLENDLLEMEEDINNKRAVIKSKLTSFRLEITNLDNKILIVEERNKNYDRFIDTKKQLQGDLVEIIKEKKELEIAVGFLSPLLDVIKSGDVTKVYIDGFVEFFNIKLKELNQVIDIDFTIEAYEDFGAVSFRVIADDDEEIGFDGLSSGEQTRVALVVLITSVLSLQTITNTNFNLLILDELLSVLDEAGIVVFKSLLTILRNDKNIFIVQHHNEVIDTYFDNSLTIVKRNGISKISEEN